MLSEWSHLHNGINIANRQIDKNRFCTNTTIDPISFCSVCYFPFCSKFGASPIVRSQTFFHYVIVAVLLFCQRFILYIYTSIPTAIKLNRKERKKNRNSFGFGWDGEKRLLFHFVFVHAYAWYMDEDFQLVIHFSRNNCI